ncbi:hydrogenase 2 large subunit [Vibrio algarum]|uniref:Hydrogenase 2 large subunit n=1 Tax=Vibrio algarum TaxID=3020714 RepID=A0ABT4YLT3_9VIBR|nr:hydrogenase 2 large subunit [Vibrio sp. KJ40-1]MDB1122372.1 hydrogenase 2 large subunit [Vibrio sp. KJ40-1]
MSQRITIDPVTRIEGHLRIDCEIEDGKVTNAWSSGTMWRGMEEILKGQDPRDAWVFTQRICGVCTTVHAIASVRSVESALKLDIPKNAQFIRNLIVAAHGIHDNVVHFYQLSALDWVDVVSALEADPVKCEDICRPLSTWSLNSAAEFQKVKDKLKGLVDSGQLGIFANGYWGHREMKLPPEINLIAVAHYLQALEYQRNANRIVAILGGKSPHIQNLAVGGVANPINLDAPSVLNKERLMYIKSFIDELDEFIEQVYKLDVAIVAAHYPEWLAIGEGVTNYLSIPDMPTDEKGGSFLMPGGYIENGDLSTFRPITSHDDQYLIDGIAESSKHSWYQEDGPFHPWEGKTDPNYTGFEDDGKYSWVKAPTFYGKATQVGPLAQVLCAVAAGDESTTKHLNDVLGAFEMLTGIKPEIKHLHSTLGRHATRAVRCAVLKDTMQDQYKALIDNIAEGDTTTYVKPYFPYGVIKGVGFHEAPRGMLSHWIVINDGKIENYQAVVPSTWNSGPRNDTDELGPYEQSLIGTPIADPENPLEVIRTIHSFDPCMSCAVHIVDTRGKGITKVKIL